MCFDDRIEGRQLETEGAVKANGMNVYEWDIEVVCLRGDPGENW